jgi:hypothetical protein
MRKSLGTPGKHRLSGRLSGLVGPVCLLRWPQRTDGSARVSRWRRARRLLHEVDPRQQAEVNRRIRLEGWRLVLMTVSLLTMSGIVVTVFWPGPTALLEVLRLLALLGVAGVLLLSLRL